MAALAVLGLAVFLAAAGFLAAAFFVGLFLALVVLALEGDFFTPAFLGAVAFFAGVFFFPAHTQTQGL